MNSDFNPMSPNMNFPTLPPQPGHSNDPRNATPASAHRCNRADTTKHHAHNGTPDSTPRWHKLTWQEVFDP
ncbi:hypothetical protein ILYODFUR_030913 [Ilyodon furcidens]|uniref:Uncharacterized protein n=1 Tax=Ilyodon furcidens TaxID=33524 RepID=A0ABV0T2T6_9TELE